MEPHVGVRSSGPQAVMATPAGPAAGVSDPDQFLVVPTPDKELAGELERLGKLILRHVEGNYVTDRVRPAECPTWALRELLDLGATESTVPGIFQLSNMALDPDTRVAALQHVIARVIFGSLTATSVGKISLLPPPVSSFVREMPPCEKRKRNPEGISWGNPPS